MKWSYALIPLAILTVPLFWLLWVGRGYPKKAEKDAGTYANHFMWVDADGRVNELTSDECDYLNTNFHPTDGNRPYIKNSYWTRTPDRKLHGFLLRKRVPKDMPIVPARER